MWFTKQPKSQTGINIHVMAWRCAGWMAFFTSLNRGRLTSVVTRGHSDQGTDYTELVEESEYDFPTKTRLVISHLQVLPVYVLVNKLPVTVSFSSSRSSTRRRTSGDSSVPVPFQVSAPDHPTDCDSWLTTDTVIDQTRCNRFDIFIKRQWTASPWLICPMIYNTSNSWTDRVTPF